VGARLIDVTLFKPSAAGSDQVGRPAMARADMVDRNGELLARDLPVADLYARPHTLDDKVQAARELAGATGADNSRLLEGFNNTKHPYVLVARRLTPDAQDRVMHLGLPGLEFEPSAKRFYPNGRATAQLLGVTDPDGKGVSGLEQGLDAKLRDVDTTASVQLSVDMRVQYILASEAEASRQMFHAKKAGGVVMDV